MQKEKLSCRETARQFEINNHKCVGAWEPIRLWIFQPDRRRSGIRDLAVEGEGIPRRQSGSGRRYRRLQQPYSDCLSMVEITDCTRLGGAITGEYSGNRFVLDTLAGVDRTSLSGKAELIHYEELCQIEGIPKDLTCLTLRFTAEGELLRERTFHYGDCLGEEVYPTAPFKERAIFAGTKRSLKTFALALEPKQFTNRM